MLFTMLILELDKICRLCLAKGENMLPIFDGGRNSLKNGLITRIENLTCLKIEKSDGLPSALCLECLSKLDKVKEFVDQCKHSDSVLRDYLKVKQANEEKSLEELFLQYHGKGRQNDEDKGQNQDSLNCTKQQNQEQSVVGMQNNLVGSEAPDTESNNSPVKQEPACLSENENTITQQQPVNSRPQRQKRTKRNSSLTISADNNHSADNEKKDPSYEENEYTWPGSLSDEEFDGYHSSKANDKQDGDDCSNKNTQKKRKTKLYECEFCGRTFPRSNHLMQHELTHTKEKPFHCSYCGKDFWYKNSLIGHIKQTHTGDVNYTCEDCGRGFFQRSEYMRHVPTHSNETPFKCEECDMSFKLMKNLRRHQKVHSDTRTHTCQYCGKSFRMRQTLRVHLILHTGEKPYKCEFCGRGFSQSAPLKAHIRLHTGERPYVCTLCGQAFHTGNALKTHVFKHQGVHPNSCKDCSVVFKRKRDLVEHWDRRHGGAQTDPLTVPPQIPLEEDKSNLDEPDDFDDQQTEILDSLSQTSLSPTPSSLANLQTVPPLLSEIRDPLSDDDSLLSDDMSHHQMLQNQLPADLEMSSSVSSGLLSPTLARSPSDVDELMISDSLPYE